MADPIDLSLVHNQAELVRIDARIQREVRRWQLAGQDPNDSFHGLKVTDEEVRSSLERPFGASWGQTIDLSEEAATFAPAQAEADRPAWDIRERAAQRG